MHRTILTAVAFIFVILLAHTAFAETLHGTFGIYGKGGALIPLKHDYIGSTTDANTAFATGGGIIIGLSHSVAAEIDVTHVPRLDTEIGGVHANKTNVTDVAVGLQYRFGARNTIVPYLGAGLDFITGDLRNPAGKVYDLDWTEGAHVNAGIDFFITRYIALTAEARGIVALEGDINGGGSKVAEYRPNSLIATLGLRLIIPTETYR